jgi:hypothetical protein
MVVLKKISEDSRSWDWHDDRFWQDGQLAMASSGLRRPLKLASNFQNFRKFFFGFID